MLGGWYCLTSTQEEQNNPPTHRKQRRLNEQTTPTSTLLASFLSCPSQSYKLMSTRTSAEGYILCCIVDITQRCCSGLRVSQTCTKSTKAQKHGERDSFSRSPMLFWCLAETIKTRQFVRCYPHESLNKARPQPPYDGVRNPPPPAPLPPRHT